MTVPSSQEITKLLAAWSEGDESALSQLTPLVYRELRRLAHGYMSRERAGHSLQTTALINEAYLRLIDWKNVSWQNRAHFFGIAAELMRRVLVDYARRRRSKRRGGSWERVPLDEAAHIPAGPIDDWASLDDALRALAALQPRQSRVVEMRYFGGMSVEEIAAVLGVAPRTVMRDWRMAQAWLYRELSKKIES